MKLLWKSLDYSPEEIKKASDDELKALLLNEWANCRQETPPKEFGEFSAAIVLEMKRRGINHTAYIG